MKQRPSEHVEQCEVIQWCNKTAYRYGVFELRLIFAIPNGGQRARTTGARLKAEGVKPGIPDLMLPVARSGYHGLFIEMKRVQGGGLSPEQVAWRDNLKEQGYSCIQCRGAPMAISVLKEYLNLE